MDAAGCELKTSADLELSLIKCGAGIGREKNAVGWYKPFLRDLGPSDFSIGSTRHKNGTVSLSARVEKDNPRLTEQLNSSLAAQDVYGVFHQFEFHKNKSVVGGICQASTCTPCRVLLDS